MTLEEGWSSRWESERLWRLGRWTAKRIAPVYGGGDSRRFRTARGDQRVRSGKRATAVSFAFCAYWRLPFATSTNGATSYRDGAQRLSIAARRIDLSTYRAIQIIQILREATRIFSKLCNLYTCILLLYIFIRPLRITLFLFIYSIVYLIILIVGYFCDIFALRRLRETAILNCENTEIRSRFSFK